MNIRLFKNILITIAVIFCSSCATTYTTPGFQNLSENNRTIAILPFEVSFIFKKIPKGQTIKYYNDLEKTESYSLQKKLYSSLLNHELFKVKIQDIDETNRLLENQRITIDNIRKYSNAELAKLLNVDAVFYGTAGFSENSFVANVGIDIVKISLIAAPLLIDFLVLKSQVPILSIISITALAGVNYSIPSKSSINISIVNTDDELLWRYKTYNRGRVNYKFFGERVMKKVAKKIPYKK